MSHLDSSLRFSLATNGEGCGFLVVQGPFKQKLDALGHRNVIRLTVTRRDAMNSETEQEAACWVTEKDLRAAIAVLESAVAACIADGQHED